MKSFRSGLIAIAAVIAFVVALLGADEAAAQVRLNPKPSVTIDASCKDKRAHFRIRNGETAWREMGEIIVIDEQSRTVVSRRKMRFAQNQTASYRVPLVRQGVTAGPLRLVLVTEASATTPIAHARLDCR